MSSSASAQTTPDYFGDVVTPNVDLMRLELEPLIQQGILTAEQAEAYLVNQSEMNNVNQDPATRQAQMDALSSLQDITSSGGMTDMDKAALNQITQQENTQARGQREAILNSMEARGAGGSGASLLAQLQNGQESAMRASNRGTEVAGMAQQRALDALMNQGNLATQIGSQQFNQDAAKAQANDAIAQFNANNKTQVGLSNTAARNAAQGANLGMKQAISDQNITQQNTQQQYNKQLAQKDFENQMTKRGGQANIAMNNTAAQNAAAQAKAANDNAMLGTAATIAGTAFGGPAGGAAANAAVRAGTAKAQGGLIEGPNSDYDNMITPTMSGEFVVKKEDVPDFLKKAHTDDDGEFDAAGFLDSITGGKYNYKGKK